jgi:hypothetical protein
MKLRLFRSERLDHGAPDILYSNDTMPVFPKGVSLWGRIVCLLGYHLPQERRQGDKDRFGQPLKYPGSKLRDQCGRCGTML